MLKPVGPAARFEQPHVARIGLDREDMALRPDEAGCQHRKVADVGSDIDDTHAGLQLGPEQGGHVPLIIVFAEMLSDGRVIQARIDEEALDLGGDDLILEIAAEEASALEFEAGNIA
jgi:hypothetical protein